MCVCVNYLFIKKYPNQTEMASGTKLTPFIKHLGWHIAFENDMEYPFHLIKIDPFLGSY